MRTSARLNAPLKAAALVLAAMAMIGYVDNLVVRIAQEAGLWQFHLMRALMALPLIALIGAVMGWQVRPKRPWAVTARGACLAASMLCYFGALAFLPVSQAVAGIFTAPLFVLLISAAWFRERPRAEVVTAALVGFAGCLLVLRPDPSALGVAALLPLAGGVFYALSALATRRICAGEGALSLLVGFFAAILCFSAIGVLATTPDAAPPGPEGFLARGWVAPSAQVLWLTGVQAVASVVCVGMITRAYILAEAPQVAIFEYSLLIFAALWGFALYGERIDAWGALGVALILGSGALLLRAERRGGAAVA